MEAKVLVTGGAGFIGSTICAKLLSLGHQVICLDDLDPYYDPELKKANIAHFGDGFTHVNVDICDAKAIAHAVKDADPDYVIHEAAQAGVRASVIDPAKTARVNVIGTLSLLSAICATGIKKLVFASSSSIYGKVDYLPFDEDHPKNPISPYGVTKLACEMNLNVFKELYGLDHVALRYFTVYGPKIRPDLAINKFIRSAMKGDTLGVYGDGSKSRDFTYIDDAVDATISAMKKGSGAYNIGGGTRLTVTELTKKIINNVGAGSVRYIDEMAGDVQHTESNCKKAERDLGWKPKVGFDEGLDKTIQWIKG